MGVTSDTWVTSDTLGNDVRCTVRMQHCASFPSECPKLPPFTLHGETVHVPYRTAVRAIFRKGGSYVAEGRELSIQKVGN